MVPPLVNVYKKLLKIAIEIVDLPIDSMVIFHSYVNVHQRVSLLGKIGKAIFTLKVLDRLIRQMLYSRMQSLTLLQ